MLQYYDTTILRLYSSYTTAPACACWFCSVFAEPDALDTGSTITAHRVAHIVSYSIT